MHFMHNRSWFCALVQRRGIDYGDLMKTNSVIEATSKKVLRIHKSKNKHWVGDGFPVFSVFDYNGLGRELSPFLMLDYAEPYNFQPANEKRGVGAHPHKGFETVTIAYQGEIEHRDSSGGGGKIGPGDVQWMTAGNGVVHDEFHSQDFTKTGGTFEMIQLWVNLPAKFKSVKPGYQTLLNKQIPNVTLANGAGNLRVIAGDFNGVKGPARTFTPINLWDVQLQNGQVIELNLTKGHTAALFLLRGNWSINEEHQAEVRDLVILDKQGDGVQIKANSESRFLLLGGEPIAEPIVGAGPFVMNSRSEIQKAFEDYQNGLMGSL